MNIQIIDLHKEQMNEKKYVYATCTCLSSQYAIRIKRTKDTKGKVIEFKCPKCNEDLGIYSP